MSCQPAPPFERLYARVDADQAASLAQFRQDYPPQHLLVEGVDWEYLALGEGPQTVLFLHGLAGAYDIWWHQMLALKDDYRAISVTYPGVDSLEGLAQGILVEFYYYGAVVAGGVGIYVLFSGAWETYFGERAPATALLEIEGGRARVGIPLPVPWAGPEAGPEAPPGGAGVELVRFRF